MPVSMLYPNLPATTPRLRLGVIADDQGLRTWQRQALEHALATTPTDLALLIITPTPRPIAPRGIFDWLLRRERSLHPERFQHELRQPLDFPGVERLAIETLGATDNHDLAVIIDFSSQGVGDDRLAAMARHGLWRYRHGGAGTNGSAPYFREMRLGIPVSAAELQCRRDGERLTLIRSFGATQFGLWPGLNRAPHFEKSAAFLSRCLRRIAVDGDAPSGVPAASSPEGDDRPPSNPTMIFYILKLVFRRLRDRMTRSSATWHVALRRVGEPRFLPVDSPAGGWYADPILFAHRQVHLFVERYVDHDQRGRIDVATLDDQGRPGPFRAALREDFHLSYPFVFEHRGEVYMLPECGEAGEVRLYRARRFPDDWVLEKVLLKGHFYVDATLSEHQGRYYLFVNTHETGGSVNDELFLYHADSPFGPFAPHPANPIVSDIRRARPAGALFKEDGALIRPGQDSSLYYGRQLILNRVEALSATHYAETPVGEYPPPVAAGITHRVRGCHSLTRAGGFEAIDLLLEG